MIESAKLAGLLQGPMIWLPATLAIYAAATALWRRHRQGADPQSHDAEHHRDRRRAAAVEVPYPAYPGWRRHPELRSWARRWWRLPSPLHRHIHLLPRKGRSSSPSPCSAGSTTSLVPRSDRRQGGRRKSLETICPSRQRRRPRRCRSRSHAPLAACPG